MKEDIILGHDGWCRWWVDQGEVVHLGQGKHVKALQEEWPSCGGAEHKPDSRKDYGQGFFQALRLITIGRTPGNQQNEQWVPQW